MRQFAVFTIALLTGAALAQAQGTGTQTANSNEQQASAAVQGPQANAAAPAMQSDVQRPIRQRLRDPSHCQASQNRPLRQRLRDPANCPRRSAGDWSGRQGWAGRQGNWGARQGNCRGRQGAINWGGRQNGAQRGGRFGPANAGGQYGMGWGRMHGCNGPCGRNRPFCPNYGGRGFHGGRHSGWGRWNQPTAPATQPSTQQEK